MKVRLGTIIVAVAAAIAFGESAFAELPPQAVQPKSSCRCSVSAPAFKTLGAMIDVSRGRVPTVPYLKTNFERMGKMGYNAVMLYTEDTYKLDGVPKWGYMRGGYTKDDIKELKAAANANGLELVPCIQTLGHLEKYLRWPDSAAVKCNDSTLIVGEPKTYELVDKMISFWQEAVGGSRIHIGMDEAWGFWEGEYQKRNGDLMSRTDETGFVVRGLDWVFIDWAKPKSNTALQAIWYGSLQAAARLADRVGDPQADDYRALAAKIRESLNRMAWDETRGLYRADPKDAAVFGRQANIFAVVFGVADDRQSVRIGDELAQDRLPPVGTPYVFGWELVALARTGHADAFFLGLERIFGGMLDNGATTYWESYDPNETGDGRYAFYGRPWAKSLCHVWSAWPAFIFVSEGLGIRPTADGWRAWSYRPLPGCENLKAEIPTPNGIVRLGGASN